MVKLTTLFGCLLVISINLFASYSTDWIRPAGNYMKSGAMIARDKADNVIVTGYIQSENIYTRKYDKFGNFQWESVSSSGIDNNYEKPVWVNCDNDKNIYVVGYQYTIGSGWDYPNTVVVLKYNESGTLIWKQIIALSYIVGPSTGLKFNLKSELDKSGNLYIGTAGTSPSGFVFMKLSGNGTILVNTAVNLGIIHGFSSMRLKGDKVISTGTASYNSSLAIVAWDTAGAFLWSKVLTGFSGKDVEIDGSGNSFILTTYPDQVSGTSGNDFVIYKFNSAGVQTWKKSYDFGGEELANRFTLVSGKLSVIGYGDFNGSYYADWVTFQIKSNGEMLWNARYDEAINPSEQPNFLAAKDNGEVFVTGYGGPWYTLPNGSSYLRMVTLKYGNTGTVQWVDSVNIYSGWGLACTLASDSSLFVLSRTDMTAFHFLDYTGTGSCGIPADLKAKKIKDTSAKFSWSPVTGAYLYHLRYKTTTAADWTTVSTDLTEIKIATLSAGTSYEYAVEAICNSGPSGFSASKNFTTTGAGYCATGGLSTALEYLTFVWIGAIQNVTGNNNGYADFTNLSTDLAQGSTVSGVLTGTLPVGLFEHYSIWIDYNHNNDFTDPGEQEVEIISNYLGYILISFAVPANATLGPTRMRVTMEFGNVPSPCGSYARGETEDYSVNITSSRMGIDAESVSEISAFPNPATSNLTAKFSGYDGNVTVKVFDLFGKVIFIGTINSEDQFQMDVQQLASGVYMLRATDEQGHTASLKWVKE